MSTDREALLAAEKALELTTNQLCQAQASQGWSVLPDLIKRKVRLVDSRSEEALTKVRVALAKEDKE